MDAIRTNLRALCVDTRGATAIEYGLIVAMIAVACIGGLEMMGGGSKGMWSYLQTKVENPRSP